MQFLTNEILLLMVFVADIIQAELNPSGENVCLHTETYQETIPVEVKKPVKQWCFRLIPYRCYKIKMKKEEEPRVVERTKIVPKCCSGYEEKKGQVTTCVPVCQKGCKNGKCAAPNTCACAPGFYGAECEKECPKNFWGENCANKCDCSDNGKCHKVFGKCECEPGWRGKRCELACQSGYYGHSCKEKCNCNDHLCNHKTGECTTTTVTIIVDQIMTSIQSERTTTNTEIETFTEIRKQTEMSTSTTEMTTSIFSTSNKNTVSGGNLLEDVDTTEGKTASEEMPLHTSETTAGGSTTAKFREANKSENEIKLISFRKMYFSISLETTTENVNKIENKTEEIPLSETYSKSTSTEDTTDWLSRTYDNERNADINETTNFIGDMKENSDNQRAVTIYYFLPSFSVISSASFLIIIIAAKWIGSTYRKKAKKVKTRTVIKEKFCQQEEQIKFQTENFFWVNNCTKNPVYLSDVELNSTTPILETFKPSSSDKFRFERE